MGGLYLFEKGVLFWRNCYQEVIVRSNRGLSGNIKSRLVLRIGDERMSIINRYWTF